MLGIFGSLSISVLSCCVLLLVMGMFGYLKYGSQVQASITSIFLVRIPWPRAAKSCLFSLCFCHMHFSIMWSWRSQGQTLLNPLYRALSISLQSTFSDLSSMS